MDTISAIKEGDCTGCGACAQVCPRSCIEMKPSKEGFLHPAVEEDICISCGKCILNCPMSLVPREIEKEVGKEDYEGTFKMGVLNCIECGACSYSCPAKRPLVQAMRLAKKEIKARGIK